MKCKKCGTKMQLINCTKVDTKHRGCLMWMIWLILAICTCGLILIIPLVTNTKVKSKNETYMICPNCGYRKKI